MPKTAIIIPCYNEEKRLKEASLVELLQGSDAQVYLANDGSTDQTLSVLEGFAQKYPDRCHVLHYEQNSGKANTIYKSVTQLMPKGYDYIGYFDADFSIPPYEVIRLMNLTQDGKFQFVFASRVLLLNTRIERKMYRHIIGRILITLINLRFKLKIYDTQCGGKIFSREVIPVGFSAPFKTSWLFDAEIFVRLKKQGMLRYGREEPLYECIHVEGSKLGLSNAIKIFWEVTLLYRNY